MNCIHCNMEITYDDNAINNLLGKIKAGHWDDIQQLICKTYHGRYPCIPIMSMLKEDNLLSAIDQSIQKLFHDAKTWIKIDKGGVKAGADVYEIVNELYKTMELYKLAKRLNQ